jgi:hypothetical protein
MDSKPMFIEVRQKDEICLVRCEGRLVTADHEYLHAKKDEIKRANCKKVLADFSEVPEIVSLAKMSSAPKQTDSPSRTAQDETRELNQEC